MKLILDTDIGTDIDDAYALAMIMRSPIDLIGVSTVSGDTLTRAKIAAGLLRIQGKQDVQIFAGPPSRSVLTQAEWAIRQPAARIEQDPENMQEFYWQAIDTFDKDELCIAAIGPLTNIAAIRARNPAKFDERVRLLFMGGSIYTGYLGLHFPLPEYNVAADRKASRALLDACIEMDIFPLDSTQDVKLEETIWNALKDLSGSDPLSRALVDLTLLFKRRFLGATPVLFDPVTLAVLLDPSIGTFTALDLKINSLGMTRIRKQTRGESFCKKVYLRVDKGKFNRLFADSILQRK
jgi:purine nucleosidase